MVHEFKPGLGIRLTKISGSIPTTVLWEGRRVYIKDFRVGMNKSC